MDVMQRVLTRMFRDGTLGPDSPIDALPHIGPYLSTQLLREFSPRQPTVRGLVQRLARLGDDSIRRRLQTALQNRRANQCVQWSDDIRYHVPDINHKGWETCISLIKVCYQGRDGHALARTMRCNPSRLRMPNARSYQSKVSGCLRQAECIADAERVFADRLCMPADWRSHGFVGVHPHPGQKSESVANSRGRRYARHPVRGRWRTPGRQPRL